VPVSVREFRKGTRRNEVMHRYRASFEDRTEQQATSDT